MGKTSGGWMPSPQSQQNFVGTLLAISRLAEQQNNARYLNSLREQETAKQALQAKEIERKARDINFENLVEGVLGQKGTPETQQAMFGARQMYQPGGTVTAPTGNFSNLPSPEGTGGTIPNVMNRIANTGDISNALRQGKEDLRSESLANLTALGIKPDDPLYQRIASSSRVELPSEVGKRIKEREDLAQEATKTAAAKLALDTGQKTQESYIAEQAGKAASATAKGQVDTATVQEDILKRRSDAYKAEADSTIQRANAVYATINAANDAKIKTNEALIKEAERQRQPDIAVKLKGEIRQQQLTAARTSQEIAQHNEMVRLYSNYNSETDPAKKTEILRQQAVLAGQSPAVLSNNFAIQKEASDLLTEAQKLKFTASAEAAKGTPEGAANAQQALNTANQHLTKSARYNNSDTVTLTTAFPQKNILGNVNGAAIGSVVVPTSVAEKYGTGELLKIASGQVQNPTVDPASALAWYVRIERAYGQGDPAAFAKGISDAMADPLVKERALGMISSIIERSKAPSLPTTGEERKTRVGGYLERSAQGFSEAARDIKKGLEPVGKIADKIIYEDTPPLSKLRRLESNY